MARLTKRIFDSVFAWRDWEQLSQEDAARLFDITQAHWSRLENGEVGASPKLAKKISKRTGVPMERLLNFGDDDSGVGAVRRELRSREIPKDMP